MRSGSVRFPALSFKKKIGAYSESILASHGSLGLTSCPSQNRFFYFCKNSHWIWLGRSEPAAHSGQRGHLNNVQSSTPRSQDVSLLTLVFFNSFQQCFIIFIAQHSWLILFQDIILDAIVTVVALISSVDCSLLTYRNTINYSMLIMKPWGYLFLSFKNSLSIWLAILYQICLYFPAVCASSFHSFGSAIHRSENFNFNEV